MRIRPIILLCVLALAACSGDGSGATTTTSPENTTTTTAETTTTLAPTTTTQATTTTTTTPDPMAYLVDPSDEDYESYALIALLSLNETVFSPEEMGNQEFVQMLEYGAQQACINYHTSERLTDAIPGALSASPVSGTSSDDWTSEEQVAANSAALTVLNTGMPYYCPSIAPEFSSDNSAAAEEFTNAWLEYLGEEPLDTEGWIRDGTWEVGVDIEPGTYRNSGSEGCYWERLDGFSGDSSYRIANGFPDGDPDIVTILPSDAGFHSEDCGRWTPTE